MNITTESRYRLNHHKNKLEELQGLLSSTNTKHLSKDARHYIEDEVTKAKRNIEYYSEILKVLEDK